MIRCHVLWAAILGPALLLSACSGTPAAEPENPAPLEPVLTWYVQDDAVFVRVTSGGCTNESSFEPTVYLTPGWVAEVELERVEEDECEAFLPNGTLVSWTREELGIPQSADIELQNPTRTRVPRSR